MLATGCRSSTSWEDEKENDRDALNQIRKAQDAWDDEHNDKNFIKAAKAIVLAVNTLSNIDDYTLIPDNQEELYDETGSLYRQICEHETSNEKKEQVKKILQTTENNKCRSAFILGAMCIGSDFTYGRKDISEFGEYDYYWDAPGIITPYSIWKGQNDPIGPAEPEVDGPAVPADSCENSDEPR